MANGGYPSKKCISAIFAPVSEREVETERERGWDGGRKGGCGRGGTKREREREKAGERV